MYICQRLTVSALSAVYYPQQAFNPPRTPTTSLTKQPKEATISALPHPTELTTIVQALDDKRAKDITVLDLTGASETLSYFIVATGESLLQLKAMEDEVRYTLKDQGILPRGVEGPSERWVLIDYGDIVVHLMSADAREFYDLEGLWADAKQLDILADVAG